MDNKNPLSNRNILVTRARRDKDPLVTKLNSYGAQVYYAPTIEITEPESFDKLDQAIIRLLDYDWAIFTSRNAVDAFLNRFNFLEKPIEELAKLKILAVGLATAKALERANISVTLIPENFHAEGALASLENYYENKELLAKSKFLFPRALVGRDVLPIELEKLGAKVDLVVAYQSRIPQGAKEEISNIFANQKIDLITFTSPSTINNLVELVSPQPIIELLKNTIIACIGPVTAIAVQEAGLKVDICANESTVLSLAEAIKNYFN
ncbi:MAG: uroporphyrinogen-III synthase [Acidobacteria bacterium]|nr:uroporphyrinogen-III synthase [Acidobacteriota bacterium]